MLASNKTTLRDRIRNLTTYRHWQKRTDSSMFEHYNPVLNLTEPKYKKQLETQEETAEAISPALNLKADSPPTLLLCGGNDRLLEQVEQFMARSSQIGHRAEIEITPEVGHGFFNKSPWLQKTTERADQFLVSLGYLSPNSSNTQQ